MRSNEELDAISRSIRNNNSFKMDVLSEPTAEAFRHKLLEGQYHIVHYIGHGGIARGEGNLILHDYADRSYWLSQNELAAILPPSVQLLCLSTCFTTKNYQIKAFNRLGQTWVRHDLPSMIANQFQLSGRGVRIFWDSFYRTLVNFGEVGAAVSSGRQAMVGSNLNGEWGSFVLHLRNASDKLFLRSTDISRTRLEIPDKELDEKSQEAKGIEIQINFVTNVLNDLKNQVTTLGTEPLSGLQKVIEGTEKRHSDLLSKYDSLKRSLHYE